MKEDELRLLASGNLLFTCQEWGKNRMGEWNLPVYVREEKGTNSFIGLLVNKVRIPRRCFIKLAFSRMSKKLHPGHLRVKISTCKHQLCSNYMNSCCL